tara:strand:+ start:873 stop:1166 length:294 start_codon:yes stop_codon:yes gene_type:complete
VNNKKKETLTRSDIEKSLNIQFPTLSKSDIRNAVDAILESITEAVALDERVELRSFGTFSKKFIRPRKFTNPKTKKVSYLGETATMHFKSSKALIDK